MESIIATFHIDWKILIAQLVNFGVVAVVLWWFALKPLTKLMLERTATIEASLAEAKRITEHASSARAEREALIKEARQQAQQLLTEAEARSNEQRTKAIEQAKTDVQKIVADGKVQLRQEREQMQAALQAELADLVVAASTQVLAQTVDAAVDKKLAEKAVAQVTVKLNN